MLYLISQMLFSLVLAGLLGAAVAWWFQQARGSARVTEMSRVIQKQHRMLAQADNDVRLANEDYDELKRQSVDEITRLREENRQIAVLEHNLQKSQVLVRQLLQKQTHQGTASVTSLVPPAPTRTEAQPQMSKPAKKQEAAIESAPSADAETERRRTGGLESRVATGRNRKQKSVPNTQPSFAPTTVVPPAPASRDLPTTALPVSGHADSLVPLAPLHASDDQSPPAAAEVEPPSRSVRRGWGSAPTPDVESSTETHLSKSESSSVGSPEPQSLEQVASTPEPAESESPELVSPEPTSNKPQSLSPKTLESQEPAPQYTISANAADENVAPESSLIYDPVEPYDDLQQIVGIGPLTEKGLNRLGITTYSQLAHLDSQDIVKIAEALEIGPGRIASYDWVGSARQQLEDVLEEL